MVGRWERALLAEGTVRAEALRRGEDALGLVRRKSKRARVALPTAPAQRRVGREDRGGSTGVSVSQCFSGLLPQLGSLP